MNAAEREFWRRQTPKLRSVRAIHDLIVLVEDLEARLYEKSKPSLVDVQIAEQVNAICAQVVAEKRALESKLIDVRSAAERAVFPALHTSGEKAAKVVRDEVLRALGAPVRMR